MNKGELIDEVAERASASKKLIDLVISATLEVVAETVAAGDRVTLVGFGTFEPRDRQAREGRNPTTGEPIKIPSSRVPGFSAGKAFKEKVAKK
jgi:DNA-binding protein HU-beta